MTIVANWHPILDAQERTPGVWVLPDPLGKEYGRVELRRVNDGELRYKVTFRGEVIGWAGSLKYACERLHYHWVRAQGPQGGPNGR